MEKVLKTIVASLWNSDIGFRKDILENVNETLDEGIGELSDKKRSQCQRKQSLKITNP